MNREIFMSKKKNSEAKAKTSPPPKKTAAESPAAEKKPRKPKAPTSYVLRNFSRSKTAHGLVERAIESLRRAPTAWASDVVEDLTTALVSLQSATASLSIAPPDYVPPATQRKLEVGDRVQIAEKHRALYLPLVAGDPCLLSGRVVMVADVGYLVELEGGVRAVIHARSHLEPMVPIEIVVSDPPLHRDKEDDGTEDVFGQDEPDVFEDDEAAA